MTTADPQLADLGVAELARRTTSGEVTAVEVTEACLQRIADRDPGLNAFSVVLADEARAEAALRDGELAAGRDPGPLHGVPVAIKEEIAVAGCVTTFGGRGNSTPEAEDGVLVARLRAAGAVIIGKTRMPEFGTWPFTESVAGGITRNPWNPDHTPGGSSGGTAVAVAAGMVPVGLGGDSGGSIRIPSACCGLFGLKPERGRISTSPLEHLWWALGVAGPLSRSVLDSAVVYDVIRGNLPTDMFTAPEPPTSFTEAARAEPGRLRIGWSTKSPNPLARPDESHVRAVHDTAQALTDLGHDVREIEPHYPDITAAFVPQFFAGVRAEADAVEHYDRLENRIREVYRLGSWARPGVVRAALRAGNARAPRSTSVSSRTSTCCSPRRSRTGRGAPACWIAAVP